MKNIHQKDYWSQPPKLVTKAKISKPFLVVPCERNIKKKGTVLCIRIPKYSSRVQDFLGSIIALDPWKSQKKKKTNQKKAYLCFLTHVYAYLQNSVKSYYMSLKREKGTCLVFRQKRVNFRDHFNWWHSKNHAWKINYFFISSKTKPGPHRVCYAPRAANSNQTSVAEESFPSAITPKLCLLPYCVWAFNFCHLEMTNLSPHFTETNDCNCISQSLGLWQPNLAKC